MAKDGLALVESLDDGRAITDVDRVVLFVCAMKGMFPPWSGGHTEVVLARLLDWPIERVNKAFSTAEVAGYLSHTSIDLDIQEDNRAIN